MIIEKPNSSSHYYDTFIKNHPLSNFLFWSSTTIVVLIACLFIYMVIFEIDIVASAYGKVIPEGRIKTIQPIIGGKISKIHIKEGQLVQAEEKLITLDASQYEHDLKAVNKELEHLEKKIKRLEALTEFLQNHDLSHMLSLPAIEDSGLHNEISSFNEQIKEFQDSLESNTLELKIITSQIETSKKNIEYINYRIKVAKELSNKVMPRATLIELENKLQNLIHEREKSNYSYKVKHKEVEILKSKLNRLKTDLLFKSYYELDQLNKDRSLTMEAIEKLKYTVNNMVIKSPITGYIENSKIFTLGGVITSGEELMNIVPHETKTKLEANLPSKDIGFIKFGQKVAIKLDTFPYTQYGTIQGNVCKIATDSFTSDNINYYYKIDICLDKNYMQVRDSKLRVQPGYTATVDIYTDRRKIIDFFLAPIKIAISNSFREK